MKKFIQSILLFFPLILVSQNTITKSLGDFSVLKVYNGIELELIKSDKKEIIINGEKADKVKIKNIDGTLKIMLSFPSISAGDELSIQLYYDNVLNTIDANEGAIITGDQIKQETIEIKAQEKAFVNLELKVNTLKIKASSGGIIKIEGSANNQEIDVDLYGVYHGYDLKNENETTVRAGSGAKAEVFPGEKLNAKVTFGGSILYKGNPDIIKDKKVAGGIIKKKDF